MCPKAPAAVLRLLLCVPLCCSPLLAKPTRPVAHDSARRFLVATPALREGSRARTLHRPASSAYSARAASVEHSTPHHAGALPHAPLHTRASASSRQTAQPWTPNHVEARAKAAYAADSATIDRVHIWELTHRNPPASDHSAHPSLPSQDEPAQASDNDTTQTLLGDNSDLVRTTSELPRIKSIEDEAATPVILPSLYNQRGQLVVPAPLYGSHEVLLHQNQMADRDGLDRVRDDADLLDLRRDKKLVALPVNEALRVDDRLPANRRFSRPWTADFLAVLARDYYASFREPLTVDSAVRTIEFQRRLLRTNGNAAPATGDTASPHLTGQAVDIAKRGLTLTEIAWMRTYLEPLIEQGKIDVEEEFQQSCFHISVYRNYLPTVSHLTVAAAQQPQTAPTY